MSHVWKGSETNMYEDLLSFVWKGGGDNMPEVSYTVDCGTKKVFKAVFKSHIVKKKVISRRVMIR